MKDAAKRGVFNGLLISFWTLAFLAVPRVATWIYYQSVPVVQFNWR